MRATRVIVLVACLCAVAAMVAWGQVRPIQKDGVFIHVSHGAEDAHRLLMAFRMAGIMAEAGRPVLVYCDIKAVGALIQGTPDITFEQFPSAHTQLQRMLDLGVLVRACPTCMKIAGYTEDQLVAGVKLANRDEFFTFTDGRILSLDY